MGLVPRPDRPGKYNVLLTHSLFAQSEQHRDSPALSPLAIDSESAYPRVVSCGVFANNDSLFSVNEEERFALLLPHVGSESAGKVNGASSTDADSSQKRAMELMAQFMRSGCTAEEFTQYLTEQPPLGSFKLCISDGSVVIFFCAVENQAFHLREGIWSFDAYHTGPLRHPSYVEVYFRSSLAIWQQVKGPFLSTFLQQLCLMLYQSSQKVHRMQTSKAQVDATDPAGVLPSIAGDDALGASTATGAAGADANKDSSCPTNQRVACHSFVSCTVVSLKEDGAEVLQMHAHLPNFNAFAFTSSTPVRQRADGHGRVGESVSASDGTGDDSLGGDLDLKAKMPKKYISAFNFFSRFFRSAVKELNVKLPGAKLNEVISEAWRALGAASLKPLDELAEHSKMQYLRNVDKLREETGKVLDVKRPKLKAAVVAEPVQEQQQVQPTPVVAVLEQQQEAAQPQPQQQRQRQRQMPQQRCKDLKVADSSSPCSFPVKHKRRDSIGSSDHADSIIGGQRKKTNSLEDFCDDDISIVEDPDCNGTQIIVASSLPPSMWWDDSSSTSYTPARDFAAATPDFAKLPHTSTSFNNWLAEGTGDDLKVAAAGDIADLPELQLELRNDLEPRGHIDERIYSGPFGLHFVGELDDLFTVAQVH
jgi:hypothetical protein